MNLLRSKALELLARREHSQFELQQKLLHRGFNLQEIELLLTNLAQLGLQSDQRFSEAYVRKRAAIGYGPKQIAQELRQRGIVTLPEIILNHDDPYWWSLLTQVQYKKFRVKPINQKAYIQQMNFLLYRGFDAQQIRRLLGSVDNSLGWSRKR